MSKNLLHYLYHQNYYKLIGIDLSSQTNTNIPQQINFVEFCKIERRRWWKNVFSSLKNNKSYSKFFFRFINCNRIHNVTE